MGARRLSKHLARCVEGLCREIDAKRQHLFLVGRTAAVARSSVCPLGAQDAPPASYLRFLLRRLSGLNLVLSSLCRAGDLCNFSAARPSAPSFAPLAPCAPPPRRACAFLRRGLSPRSRRRLTRLKPRMRPTGVDLPGRS